MAFFSILGAPYFLIESNSVELPICMCGRIYKSFLKIMTIILGSNWKPTLVYIFFWCFYSFLLFCLWKFALVMNSTTEAIFFKKLIIFLKILIMQVHTLIGMLHQVQGRDSKTDTGILFHLSEFWNTECLTLFIQLGEAWDVLVISD